MPKSKCVPLKVTAHLVDGRFSSADGIVMLDSILYHAWFIKHAPHVLEGIYKPEEIGFVGLPLKNLRATDGRPARVFTRKSKRKSSIIINALIFFGR